MQWMAKGGITKHMQLLLGAVTGEGQTSRISITYVDYVTTALQLAKRLLSAG